MKYAAVAVTLVGAAIADKTLDVQWETYSTTEKKSDPTTWTTWDDPSKKTTTTWTTWDDPSKKSTTWSNYDDPSKKTTWTTWDDPSKKTTSTWSNYEDPSTKTTWTTWDDPAKKTTTWSNYDTTSTKTTCSYVTEVPVTKCAPWDEKKEHCSVDKTKTTYYAETCTWADWQDPSKKTTTWSNYDTTSTKTKCTYVTEVPVTKCAPWDEKKEHCSVDKTKTTYYADTCTWSDWEDPSKKTTTTWSGWEAQVTEAPKCKYEKELVKVKCNPKDNKQCYYTTLTKTVYPTDCAEYEKTKTYEKPDTTWYQWNDDDSKTWTGWAPEPTDYDWEVYSTVKGKDGAYTWSGYPAKETATYTWSGYPAKDTATYTWSGYPVKETTSTWATVPVVTSVVKPEWSKDGWFGPAWPTAKSGECVYNVVTSYGYPSWKPVPEKSTTWSNVEVSTKKVVESTTWAAVETVKPNKPEVNKDNGKKVEYSINVSKSDKWSMTYSPYTAQGKCKTEEVIKVDIKKISDLGFKSVRVYSTDCETLKFVGGACKEYNLKIILGVFISKTGIEGAKAQVQAIKEWAVWEIVELIVIGNEAVYQGFCQADELVAFIKYSKDIFAGAGYKGACTTTEPLAQWQKEGSKFCDVVDVVSANLYAYFNAQTKAENAGVFIKAQIEIVTSVCKNKDVYVMESGWPSEGQCNGVACPGKDNQKVAIKSIKEQCGANVVFFSFEDEMWKEPGQYGVEQHWGCAAVFGDNSYSQTWSAMPVTKTTTATTWAAATTWGAAPTAWSK